MIMNSVPDIQIAIELLSIRILIAALNSSFMSDDDAIHTALHRAASLTIGVEGGQA